MLSEGVVVRELVVQGCICLAVLHVCGIVHSVSTFLPWLTAFAMHKPQASCVLYNSTLVGQAPRVGHVAILVVGLTVGVREQAGVRREQAGVLRAG